MSHIVSYIKRIGLFDISVRLLIVLLPFTTVLTVFGKVRMGIDYIGFYKEILILVLVLTLAWKVRAKSIHIRWGLIDILLGIYIVNLVVVSIFTTELKGIIYGGRYDFAFLIVFWVLYHGSSLLKENVSYYIRLFIISCGTMLVISALLKYPFSEDLLLYVGFSGNPSAWEFGGVPPIFHGIDGANIRRLQGILDSPNTMGAFLLMFIGFFTYYFRSYKKWYFMNGGIIIILVLMIVYTYSRSALLGALVGIFLALAGSLAFVIKRYRKEFLTLCLIGVMGFGAIYIQYADRIGAIVGRAGSTQGHLERMKIGAERVSASPLGQGLGSAGPAYRHVYDLEGLDRATREEKDRFYIPESWYIQQFVEGGILGGLVFIALMITLFIGLWRKHVFLGSMFAGITVMNLLLHTFESAPFSLLFFILVGLILGSDAYGKRLHHR